MKININTKHNIIAIIALIIICFAITPKTFQNDTFYTIKIGEHILQNGIDMQDPFSWHEGLPYTYPHWAYDVITYIIYNATGFCGLYIVTSILSIILGITLYITSKKISKSYIISLILTIVTMIIFRSYIAARAQLVTFILFVLTILFIEKFLETKKIKYAIMLVIIPIIIANIHLAVWPFYFILFLPYIAEYLIAIFYKKWINKEGISKEQKLILQKNDNTKWLILIAVVAMLTGFLTPLGTTPYTYLIKTMQGTTTQSISEHTPLVLFNKKELIILFAIFITFFSFTKVKIKLSDLLMISGLTILAIASNRQVSMLLLIGTIIFAKLINNLITLYMDTNWEEKASRLLNNKLIYCLIILAIILSGILLYIDQIDDKFINEKSYPVQASKWIKENLDIENIKLFNEYNYGSYLLYQDIPVFIDSRADLYAPEFNGKKDENGKLVGKNIFDDFINISSITTYYQTKFDEYGITHVILQRNTKLNMLLSHDENYNQIYLDENFVIYEIEK